MSGIFCSKCGEKHTTDGQFCKHCGNDLESTILRYKQKKLPIKFNDEHITQPHITSQDPHALPVPKKQRKVAITVLRLSSVLLLLTFILLISFARTYEIWYSAILGTIGVLTLISIITISVISPSRASRTGCWSSDCSGCGDCGGCSCADCTSDCGGCDCGDCGGCDC
ncbi:MAG: hypothetical protein ACTSO5_07900 [Candidatus Heimdallarchaeaceae archaeon]